MIPILFDSYAKTFATNGIGRLTDCVSCEVTEERNGIFELEMQYPITGVHYADIAEGNIIVTDHDEQKDKQPFVIYRISRPISGIVTVNAHHVSYDAANVIISPLTATSVTDAFASISANALTENPFTLWTDKTSSGTFAVKVPSPLKAILGGQKGSILDAFGGGEYEWDGYTIRLYAHRGRDNGVTIRYGKNLTNVVAERDTMGLYNAVIPYWADGKETVVYGGIVTGSGGIQQKSYWTDERGVTITDENGAPFEFAYYIRQVTSMDLSQEFDEQPTVAELEARALQILNSNQPWIPKDNIKVDFVALWQTEEYKDIAPLERVRLCDTVSIYYPELGVDAKSKVIKVVWDCLAERYSSIELGTAKTSFADVITAETEEKLADVPNLSMMEQAISDATALITGGMGGHIVFLYDADGKPTDMLVMDTEDVTTAVHVLRINVNGIGFSSTGVSGPYTSAWTLDGKFVADFITAGTMSANRIKGGTLTLGGADNGNGLIVVYDASGAEIGRWDCDGLSATGDIVLKKYGFEAFVGEYAGYQPTISGKPYWDTECYGLAVQRRNAAGKVTAHKSFTYDNSGFGEISISSGFNTDDHIVHATFDDLDSEPTNYYNISHFYAEGDYIVTGAWKNSGTNGMSMRLTPSSLKANGKDVAFQSSSSKRYKKNISREINADADPNLLYQLEMKQFVFNDDHPLQYADMRGQAIPGFIAEDVAEIYPAAVIHDADGNVESWDERRIIPGMLALIQDQKKQLDDQAEKISQMEDRLAKLEALLIKDGR